MLECLPPSRQPELVAEVHRVLRPGGSLLLGHHDYAGIILHSKNEELTRRLVDAYATQTQEWMASADGAIGRKLPALLTDSGFKEVEVRLEPLTSLQFRANSEASRLCRELILAGQGEGIEDDSLSLWLAGLDALDKEGGFFLSVPWVFAKATKAR